MTSSPIYLPKLKALESSGENLAVLSLMQQDAMEVARKLYAKRGLTDISKDKCAELADGNLPRGEALMQHFLETRAEIQRRPIQELERAGKTLSLSANSLERIAVRLEAGRNAMTMPMYAQAQHALGERYAKLLVAARTMEDSGVVPVHHTGRLGALSTRPNGPLANYFEKAVALRDQSQGAYPRERVAA